MAKILLSLLKTLIVFSACQATAGPASDKIAQREPEPFPGYAKACGYPILFHPVSSVSLARIDARLGKIIVLDPLLTFPPQAAHRRFLIAHECAHHRFDHATPTGLRERAANKGVENQELSADCWAAEALIVADEVRFIANAFYRKGLHSPGSGYPSGIQRSTLIYHCMKSAKRQKQAIGQGSD